MKKRYILFLFSLVLLILVCPIKNVVLAETIQGTPTKVLTNTTDFSNLSSFSTINNRDFVFVDQTNLKIVISGENATRSISASDDPEKSFVKPILAVQTYSEKFAVLDVLGVIGRLAIYNSNLQFENIQTAVLLSETDTTDPTNLGTDIPSMCVDYYGNVFILDKTYNYIVKYDPTRTTETKLFRMTNLSDFEIQPNSKIKCNISGTSIYVSSNNKILVINGSEQTTYTFDYNIKDFVVDCSGNVFILEDSSVNMIHKFSMQVHEEVKSVEIPAFDRLYIEQENGVFYLINNDGIYTLSIEGFVANLLTFDAPIKFDEVKFIDSEVKIAQTKENANFLSNPYSLTNYITIPQSSKIIILSEYVENNLKFSYCLFEKEDGTPELGYILKEKYEILENEQEISEKKTYNKTILYKYPTVNSPQIKVEDKDIEFNSKLLNTYTDCFGNTFYSVSTSEGIAYIKTNALISSNNFETSEIIDSYDYPIDEPIAFILIVISITLLFAMSIYVIKVRIVE